MYIIEMYKLGILYSRNKYFKLCINMLYSFRKSSKAMKSISACTESVYEKIFLNKLQFKLHLINKEQKCLMLTEKK